MEITPKKNMGTIAILLAMVVATMLGATVSAQTIPSCATKLSSCVVYLNITTTPPSSCCTPLKDALIKDLSCMCTIFNDRELLKGFGIDIKTALQLPKRCGITTFSTDACKANAPSASIPPPQEITPGGSNGSPNRVAWTGMSVMGLFLVWWSIVG